MIFHEKTSKVFDKDHSPHWPFRKSFGCSQGTASRRQLHFLKQKKSSDCYFCKFSHENTIYVLEIDLCLKPLRCAQKGSLATSAVSETIRVPSEILWSWRKICRKTCFDIEAKMSSVTGFLRVSQWFQKRPMCPMILF